MPMSTETLLREVPELAPSVRRIAEEQDDEPCLSELLGALADLVDRVAFARGRSFDPAGEELLKRCFQAVEVLAAEDDDSDGPFLVGSAFLDALSSEARARVAPLLGPATQAVLADLELGWPEEELALWEAGGGLDDELDEEDEELEGEEG
jgi:hypothetical protein